VVPRDLSASGRETVGLLVAELGMTEGEAGEVVLRSDDNLPGEAWEYKARGVVAPLLEELRRLGLTRDEVRRVIAACPTLIRRKAALVPAKVAVLAELGVRPGQLGRLMVKFPQVLNLSEESLRGSARWLREDAGLSEAEVQRVVVSLPRVLSYSIPDNLARKRAALGALGWGDGEFARTVAKFPQVLGLSLDNIAAQYLHLQAWGLPPPQVSQMVQGYPCLLGYRPRTLDVKALVLTGMLGLPLAAAVRFPTYFGYSLEKRVCPRAAFACHLLGDADRVDVPGEWTALDWPPLREDAEAVAAEWVDACLDGGGAGGRRAGELRLPGGGAGGPPLAGPPPPTAFDFSVFASWLTPTDARFCERLGRAPGVDREVGVDEFHQFSAQWRERNAEVLRAMTRVERGRL